jgi:uncharacterized membrane protein
MSRKTIYFQHSFLFFAFLLVLIFAVFALVFFGAVSIAFQDVGFAPLTILLILVGCLVGSFINIPLIKLRTKIPIVHDEYVSWFGVTYRIPQVEYGEATTMLAVNVGGALIPTGVSFYLLSKSPLSTINLSLIGVLAVAAVST